jgi:hypothetical protein
VKSYFTFGHLWLPQMYNIQLFSSALGKQAFRATHQILPYHMHSSPRTCGSFGVPASNQLLER